MVNVEFAASLQRYKPCPAQNVQAGPLASVLHQAFAAEPGLQHYVLDDQGHIRKHVAVFINGAMHQQRQRMDVDVVDNDKVLVIQCLTGG
jgi:sulfur-carrier protein